MEPNDILRLVPHAATIAASVITQSGLSHQVLGYGEDFTVDNKKRAELTVEVLKLLVHESAKIESDSS